MKISAFLVCILYLNQAYSLQHSADFLNKNDIECLAEAKIDSATMLQHVDEKFKITTGNPSINTFTECMAKRVGAIKGDGTFDFVHIKKEMVQKLIPFFQKNAEAADKEKLADTAIEKCKDTNLKNIGEKVIKFHNCVVDVIAS